MMLLYQLSPEWSAIGQLATAQALIGCRGKSDSQTDETVCTAPSVPYVLFKPIDN